MVGQESKMTFRLIEDGHPLIGDNAFYHHHCVTYMLSNDKDFYVGETSNLFERSKQHAQGKKAYKFEKTYVIHSDYFNKSAVYDIESKLINFIYADGKYNLVNLKLNQKGHEYYRKEDYNEDLFSDIWQELLDRGVVNKTLFDIENSNIFKYSPFKEFSDNQLEAIDGIIKLVTRKIEVYNTTYDGTRVNMRRFVDEPTVSRISGEPGTGKTLVAFKIIFDLVRNYSVDPKDIVFCAPQAHVRKEVKKMLKEAKLHGIKTTNVVSAGKVQSKFIIVDEAHRLKQYNGKHAKDLKHLIKGENKYITELEYLKSATNHLLLMYDERQSVRPVDMDKRLFKGFFYDRDYSLDIQFRVKAGAEYLKFIRYILGIENEKAVSLELQDYELEVVDSIEELHNIIKEKDREFGLARMVSGYYVPWISKKNPKAYDFEDRGYQINWNTTIEGWSNTEKAIDEVGCIHTIQGVDLNYVGVIIGDDIYYDQDEGKVKVNKGNYYDSNGKPIKGTDQGGLELEAYIKNIYYVLLTRGILGTYIFIEDEGLREKIKGAIGKL